MDDLLAEFLAETREMLEALGGEVVAWESDPADRARLDAIFRFVHTVKGNCGFFEFPRLAALSHAAEDALADVRAGRRVPNAGLVTAVLGVIDRIADMITSIDAGEDISNGSDADLIAALAEDADPGHDVTESLAEPAEADQAPEIAITAANPSVSTANRQAVQRSVRLPVELLDRVMSSVSDIVLARNELSRRLRSVPAEMAVDGAFQRLSALVNDLRDAMTRTRMQSIDTLFASLPRLVRDLSAQLGKQVMIDIDSGDVELDREMIEMIRDPLVHVIRNAIDHGIEPPAKRQKAGKREIGLLMVSARQSGNQILIETVDDGRGINLKKLSEKAMAAGIVTADQVAVMTSRERAMLICEAGLSTADAVTEISGRGVGMDVVRANIERIGGALSIDSEPGKGTRITMQVPLTLTITPALTVRSGNERFGIPRSYVEEIVDPRSSGAVISEIGESVSLRLRDENVPVLSLAGLLSLSSIVPITLGCLVVIRLSGGHRFALAVDAVLDHEELVVKPVAPAIMTTGIYAGATLCDDGQPILLLDVGGVARLGGLVLEILDTSAGTETKPAPLEQEQVLLFTAWNGRRRAIRLSVANRVVDAHSAQLRIGVDDPSIALGDHILPLADSEGLEQADGALRVIVISDGQRQLAYPVRGLTELVALPPELLISSRPGLVAGVTLIGDEPVELLDPFWMFARNQGHSPAESGATCWLPADDRWANDFLRPVVEAAGYRVIDDPVRADMAIFIADAPSPPAEAGAVIRLRNDPEPARGETDTIYRYDLAGLEVALRTARSAARAGGKA